MKRIWLAAALALAAPAFAQQQQQTPNEEALGQRLMLEINANLQANAALIDLRRQLAAAQAKIKQLEAAPEPPKP